MRFLAVGGASSLIDVGTLAFAHEVLGLPLALATTLGFLVGLVFNFVMNHAWVFRSEGIILRRSIRFIALVLLNLCLTLLIVGVLAEQGVPYLIAKALAIGLNSVLNYVLYRNWVFSLQGAGPANGPGLNRS